MLDKKYFDKLKEKYNYNEKTIRALAKIIPNIIQYYGEEYEPLILNAILDSKIVPCNSYQTINKISKENKLTLVTGTPSIQDIDLMRNEGAYISSVLIKYDENNNAYYIDKTNRVVVTSHTFNYDSPKGLEVLTYALLRLVKSYKNEYEIKENILIKRCGISEEISKIIKDGENIYLEIDSDINKGLEEGFTLYDTEKIVSYALLDNYKCYDYHTIFTIADILKDKFKLREKINSYELEGNIEKFNILCNNNMESLSLKCNECLSLEQEMFLSMIRKDKDELANIINKKLTGDIYSLLINVYENNKKEVIKN